MKRMSETSKSIVRLTQSLVRVSSQPGEDLGPTLEVLRDWLSSNGVDWELLQDELGKELGLLVTVRSDKPGPLLCLDAPIDTAPVGELDRWRVPPFEGLVENGRLYGRGAADSKVGVAIFCHVARELQRTRQLPRGTLQVLLDGDEHTGHFGGARAYIEGRGATPAFVAIGYPGNYGVMIGARGFFRVTVETFGMEQHSGSRPRKKPANAIVKAARLIELLAAERLPEELDTDFEFGPSLNVTAVEGGMGFSQIPGRCQASIDVRLTPSFEEGDAREILDRTLKRVDREVRTHRSTRYQVVEHWPSYKVDRDCEGVRILREQAEQAFGKRIDLVVCGPSNIGNYLAAHEIPTACGFGVTYKNQHAANEWVEIASISPVFKTYYETVRRWALADEHRLGNREH